jgi:hypothetical protein
MPMRRSVAAAAIAGALVVGGATGAALFGPVLAGAQTTTTAPDGSSVKSNEDATHEANESPEQEAAEDSGQFRGHGGRHGTNEDPAHEATESPEREAAEHANGGAGGGTAPSTAPSSGTGSATRLSVHRS